MNVAKNQKTLAFLLSEIVTHYTDYDVRCVLVLKALLAAKELGYRSGFRHDMSNPEWPVITIELPSIGQVSWHMPPSNIEWDKSNEADCKERCLKFAKEHQ